MRPAQKAVVAALAAALAAALVPVASDAQTASPRNLAPRTPDIKVKGAWIPLPPKGMTNAAAYMTLINGGQFTDRLLGAACNCAARVELHEMSTAGGVMRMRPAAGIVLPPVGQVTLAPHGEHLMLTGLKQPLRAGQPVPITLQFEHAGKVTVEALVRSPPLGGME